MNFAQDKGGSSRLTGFGLVVLVHVLIVGALASGLATKIKEAVKGPIDVKVVEEKVKPPPPPEKVVPPPPDIKAPPPPFVPPPEVVVTAPPPPTQTVAAVSTTPPPATNFTPTPPAAAPAPPAPPQPKVRSAIGNCTKMAKPEMPALNWSGTASYKATFVVKGGKVSEVSFVSLRGANDRKAERALKNAIQAALTEYECTDATLEQEFVFNME
ncbi:energy transducer TonB [Roseateles sp. So40a]|uniref:energy transducer TonB n=1 Tax=Roseateles sp. So40a TaxID=3400226 RepID=UPI003A89B0CA